MTERIEIHIPTKDIQLLKKGNDEGFVTKLDDNTYLIDEQKVSIPPLTFDSLIQTDNHVIKYKMYHYVSLTISDIICHDHKFEKEDIKKIILCHPMNDDSSYVLDFYNRYRNHSLSRATVLQFGLDSYFNIGFFMESGFDAHFLIKGGKYMKLKIPPIKEIPKGRFNLIPK
jgi:hypothetical protein